MIPAHPQKNDQFICPAVKRRVKLEGWLSGYPLIRYPDLSLKPSLSVLPGKGCAEADKNNCLAEFQVNP
jgi:hypothetical protein